MGTDCREALKELQRYLDRECPVDLEGAIRAHLDACTPCTSRAEFERELRGIIARRCKDAAPSGLLDRIVADLRAR